MPSHPYLIIGNSVAAMGAVEGIRSTDPDRPVTVLSREERHTYSRPLISYLLAGKVDEAGMLYRPEGFYEENDVTPLLGVEAIGLDAGRHIVRTRDGRNLRYGKLLIATGGTPILPPNVEGIDTPGVFTFTSWEDAERIESFIEENEVETAVVVGGGLIGLKSMEALVERGIHTTLVELADQVLSATFDETASQMARHSMERAGVDVRCETTVESIQQEDGRVSGATLRCGTEVPCSLVIFAIGVLPNTRVVEDTPVDTDRGILVDDHMRSSEPDVYAAGDVAQARELFSGQKRTIPIFPNAYRQGLIAGINMAGRERSYQGGMAMNSVDVFGLPTISVGLTDPDDEEEYEILEDLDPDEPAYRKIVLREDRIVGAIFIGKVDRAGIITGLAKQRLDVSEFKDLLLSEEFGLISLPADYRRHVVSGHAMDV